MDLMSITHSIHRKGQNQEFNELEIGIIVDAYSKQETLIENTSLFSNVGMSFKWGTTKDNKTSSDTYTWRAHVGDVHNSLYYGKVGDAGRDQTSLRVRRRPNTATRLSNDVTANPQSPYFANLYERYGSELIKSFHTNITSWIRVLEHITPEMFPLLTDMQYAAIISGASGLRWINPAEAIAVEMNANNDNRDVADIVAPINLKYLCRLIKIGRAHV